MITLDEDVFLYSYLFLNSFFYFSFLGAIIGEFLKDFLRVVLDLQKKFIGNKRFSIYSLPHAYTASPTTNIYHQSGAFVRTDEPTMTYHNHPKFIIYIRSYD